LDKQRKSGQQNIKQNKKLKTEQLTPCLKPGSTHVLRRASS